MMMTSNNSYQHQPDPGRIFLDPYGEISSFQLLSDIPVSSSISPVTNVNGSRPPGTSWNLFNYPNEIVGNNVSDDSFLPKEFTQVTPDSRNCIIAYCVLFIIAATGNLTVFVSVCSQLRRLKWRITILILHLSLADLMVTFFVIPTEVFWRLTVGWYGGNFLCKLCQFFRAFGLYLSSNVVICISLDRFFAIVFPLRMVRATQRVKVMLIVAWLTATVYSTPQCIVFSVQSHPKYPSFENCVTMDFVEKNPMGAVVYNVFSVVALYFVPLVVIIATYGTILIKIAQKSREHQLQQQNRDKIESVSSSVPSVPDNRNRFLSTPSSEQVTLMARAKRRTLRLTIVIVIAFVLCWTPYVVMTLWYMFDREGAEKVDKRIQDGLFIMAVANACVNPLIYGSYTRQTKAPLVTCLRCGQTARSTTAFPVTSVI